MPQNIDRKPQKSGPYSAVMTREQFLFHETRITAKLLDEGLERDEIIARIRRTSFNTPPRNPSAAW